MSALDDVFEWVREEGEVAIYDATNTTRARRELVVERCHRENVPVMFIEIICEDPDVIEATIRETKVHSPDYEGMAPDTVIADFLERIEHYRRAYETIADRALSYAKLTDLNRHVEMNEIRGELGVRIVHFLMSLHSVPQPVWLTRHGESDFNRRGMIGGDPKLTAQGLAYARNLAQWVQVEEARVGRFTVFTSTLRRTIQTASYLERHVTQLHALDEIHAGVCEGMTYGEIQSKMPEEYAARSLDKLVYRYPRGESYLDLIDRLDPVVLMLERWNAPILIIAHQAVLRVLYAYMVGTPIRRIPHLDIPMHTVIKLAPAIHRFEETRVSLAEVAPGG